MTYKNIDIHIAIYCNVCCDNIVPIQSLHCKNDWTSSNLDYILQFLTIYMVIQGVYFLFTIKTHIPIWNVFLPQSSHILQYGSTYIAIHSNTICNAALIRIVSPLVVTVWMYISYVLSFFLVGIWSNVLGDIFSWTTTLPIYWSIWNGWLLEKW